MKTYFSEKELKYDGTQLRSLFAYMTYEILGDSIVSWIGECDIPFAHMIDGEDAVQKSEIRGGKMLHFIVEKFDVNLFSGVLMQRLLASQSIELIKKLSVDRALTFKLTRSGDDIFLDDKKLSISVATKSPTSTMLHFALNITNENTPVKTLSLSDLRVKPELFAKELMAQFASEIESVVVATQKVFACD
ncbi:MAG: DUF366 family protein [Bdellovibrionales bacterium]